MAVLCIGEQPYAERNGGTADLSITGELGLEGNLEAIEYAKTLGIPTMVCIVAGRNVLISDYTDDWDAVAMCYTGHKKNKKKRTGGRKIWTQIN